MGLDKVCQRVLCREVRIRFPSQCGDRMSKSNEDLWEEAWGARDRGDFATVRTALLSIKATHGHRVSFLVALSHAHWELEELDEAEKVMRELTRIRPDNEHFSLSLFHILLEQGRDEAAFVESDRFMYTHTAEQCREYHRAIREWHDGLLGD